MSTTLFTYALHLADNALILGQRNAEWCGHGPVLEQDIAITNISLDLIGQSRNFYQLAAATYNEISSDDRKKCDALIPRPWKEFNRKLEEDDLAFLRDERQYLHLLIAELPKGDWAFTVLRQFLFSAYQYQLYTMLQTSIHSQLAGIAEKSIKEVAYHLKWSSEWVVRLGDGTAESNSRIQSALSELWMFTGEPFVPAAFEKQVVTEGLGPDPASLKNGWEEKIHAVFSEAQLNVPSSKWTQQGGKDGKHTEHLGYLLTEMQYLQRTYPNATW